LAFKWNYKISNVDFVPNKRNRLYLGRKLLGDVLPLSQVVVKLPRYKRAGSLKTCKLGEA